jgi:ATP/maltotriose-dependent transcriptional regulator MalT
LKAVTALIAFGEVDRGRLLLAPLTELALRSGDARALADAILALGPLAIGGRHGPELAAQAERVAAVLPDDEYERRAQLLCWAAHHHSLRGDREAALRVLGESDEIVAAHPNTTLRGLTLAVRAQVESLVRGDLRVQRRLVGDLTRVAERTGDETSNAAALLLAVGLAFALGTLDDVRARRDDLMRMADRFPRQDLRWWPLAIDGSIAIAAGEFDAAERAIVVAEGDESAHGLEIAPRIAMLQRSQLMFLTGQSAQLRCLLGPRASNDNATVVLLALYGKACADSGDLEGARAIADRLASMPPVLASSGITWPQVAMCSADLAFAVDHTELAQSVWRELRPHTGTGLVMSGAGYFGAADRSLGLLAAVIGSSDEALQLLHAAEEQEAHRGARAWEAQAMSFLDEIGGRGVRRRSTLVR